MTTQQEVLDTIQETLNSIFEDEFESSMMEGSRGFNARSDSSYTFKFPSTLSFKSVTEIKAFVESCIEKHKDKFSLENSYSFDEFRNITKQTHN